MTPISARSLSAASVRPALVYASTDSLRDLTSRVRTWTTSSSVRSRRGFLRLVIGSRNHHPQSVPTKIVVGADGCGQVFLEPTCESHRLAFLGRGIACGAAGCAGSLVPT